MNKEVSQEVNKAILRLFNAIQVKEKNGKINQRIKNGYITKDIPNDSNILDVIESMMLSGEKINSSFHKSWKIVQESSHEELFIQQVMHYFSTYGLESLGVKNNYIYIPNEVLEIPELKVNNLKLTIIQGLTSQEILEKIFCIDGIALAEETLNDIMQIVEFNKYKYQFDNIQNRELKARIQDYYGIIPSEPVEYLRYVISKLTNESLLIKNQYLISKIKESNGKHLDDLIKNAPDNLASIFYRFKPLFLAMKNISKNKSFFNRLRKQAVKMHKPMSEDYLNSVTDRIKKGKDISELQNRLKKANIFRKIRLVNALKYRFNPSESILYSVRNGKGWVTDFDSEEWESVKDITKDTIKIVLKSIFEDINKNVRSKTIYIPEEIHYTLPATEKQFVGNFPSGSYVEVKEDMIAGIHWIDTDKRVDLDLSMIGVSGKVGWDSYYKTEDNKILFSGDMTAAPKPNGASELFYIKSGVEESKIFNVNYYNFDSYLDKDEVNCKIIVAKECPCNFNKNYAIDQNNIICTADINIDKKQTPIGFLINKNEKNRFYFFSSDIGAGISARENEQSVQARKYFEKSLTNSIDLGMVLEYSGANVVNEVPEDIDFIDLSPDVLDKNTILDLLK